MFKISIIVAAIVVVGYLLRKNFARSFYVLWTGEENPDWDALERKWWGKRDGGR
jgi:hypothetical protein